MRKWMVSPAGWALAVCVLLLAGAMGCGDAQRRDSGDKLRDAAMKARRLYAKAHARLSNPVADETPEALEADALRLLDAAETLLDESYERHYKAPLSTEDGEKKVSKSDAALCRQTRSRVRHLRATVFFAQAERALGAAEHDTREAHEILDDLQSYASEIRKIDEALALGETELAAALQTAQTRKGEIAARITQLETTIRDLETRKADAQKRIEKNELLASKRKAEAVLDSTPAGLTKIEEALAVEEQVHQDNQLLDEIEFGKGDTPGLMVLRADLTGARIEWSGVEAMVQGLNQAKTDRTTAAGESSAGKADQVRLADKQFAGLKTRLAAAGEACAEGWDLAAKAEAELQKAKLDLRDAEALAPPAQKGDILVAQAGVSVRLAEQNMALRAFRIKFSDFAARIGRVWETLHKDKPPMPSLAPITEYIEKARESEAKAVEEYALAVQRQSEALDRAAPPTGLWVHHLNLASILQGQYGALVAADKPAEAQAAKTRALDAIAKAQNAAPPRRSQAVLQLKNRIQEEVAPLPASAPAPAATAVSPES